MTGERHCCHGRTEHEYDCPYDKQFFPDGPFAFWLDIKPASAACGIPTYIAGSYKQSSPRYRAQIPSGGSQARVSGEVRQSAAAGAHEQGKLDLREVDVENGKKKLTSAAKSTLPETGTLADEEMTDRVNQLLAEAMRLRVEMSRAEERLEEIRSELATTCEAYDLRGVRFNRIGYEYHGWTSRSTLNKPLLLEKLAGYGVPATVLEDSYQRGTPYVSAKFVDFDLD